VTIAVTLGLLLACPGAWANPDSSDGAGALSVGSPGEGASDVPEATEDYGEFDDDYDEFDELFDDDFGLDEDLDAIDPFENANRLLLGFNQVFDRFFTNPVTSVYSFFIPTPARRGIRRMFDNFNTPVALANQLLQLRWRDALESSGAFLLNSTAGFGGFFDVAVEAGWEQQDGDFGQTLARAGVAPGPYLMAPVLGPTTLRDGFGSIVDLGLQPLTYVLLPTATLVIGGTDGFTKREEVLADLEALEESSIDYYAALRSVYLQNREAQVEAAD
jgi:phospholipid-binding lipoprotein MlaA